MLDGWQPVWSRPPAVRSGWGTFISGKWSTSSYFTYFAWQRILPITTIASFKVMHGLDLRGGTAWCLAMMNGMPL